MKLLLICLLLLFALYGQAQKVKEYYDLSFEKYNDCSWDWLSYKNNCKIAYISVDEDSKNVLQLNPDDKPGMSNRNMEFLLTKSIILPPIDHQSITVSIDIKNNADSIISLAVVGIDNNERIIFNEKAEIRNTKTWEKTIVSGPSKNIKAITINIRYNGNTHQGQVIRLKSLSIALDGKDVSGMDIDRFNFDKVELSPSYIIPLNSADSTRLIDNINEIKNKKIIGLGESAHGSETIAAARFLFLKNLVTKYNCKLILLEIPFDLALMYDLYAQGLIPESSQAIQEYLKLPMNGKLMMLFLKWLRKYNSNESRKVHILGIDNSSAGGNSIPLMDYHLELLGREKADIYLRKLSKNNFSDVMEIARNDSNIKSILGVENFTYYMYVLSDKLTKGETESFLNRDSNMAVRVSFLDSLFTEPLEKITILSHTGHLQKINEVADQYYTKLGSLLKDKYNTAYYVLNFTFGSGKFNQDSCNAKIRLIEDALQGVPKNSFEYTALKTNHSFFFYPTKYLDSNIISTMSIFRLSQNKNHFKFANIKKRFDGYVFLNKSVPFANIERVPFGYMMRFFAAKRRKYLTLLSDLPTNIGTLKKIVIPPPKTIPITQ